MPRVRGVFEQTVTHRYRIELDAEMPAGGSTDAARVVLHGVLGDHTTLPRCNHWRGVSQESSAPELIELYIEEKVSLEP